MAVSCKKNGRISNHKEEINERLEAWRKLGTGLNSLKIILQNQGRKTIMLSTQEQLI